MTAASLLAGAVGLLPGLVCLPALLRDLRSSAPRAANFPGQPAWPGAKPPVRLRTWLGTLALAFGFGLVAAIVDDGPAVPFTVSLAGSVVLIVGAARVHRHATASRRVSAAVASYAPVLAMPYLGKVGVHVGMWSPWIDRCGHPWCAVVRTAEQFDLLTGLHPDLPILQSPTLPPTVRGALYAHGAAGNVAYINGSPDTVHVFLGHGDSDKPLSASERVLAYDIVTVAGQAAIDRFVAAGVAVPPERLRVIGRPQTEGIETADGAMPEAPTVLYAPTWRHRDDQLNVSSLVVADRLVDALLARGCTVIFRRHFAGQLHREAEAMIARVFDRLADDAATTGREHVWGTEATSLPLAEAFNRADAMVSDVSGIVVDFMASEKPLALYAAQFDDAEAFRASHPTATAAYVITRDLTSLAAALDDLLGADPLADARSAQADRYLGGPERKPDPTTRFMSLLDELASGR